MRFLVDAQLPQRLVLFLTRKGHDAVHTLDLPKGNATPDADINELSVKECRVVITKDDDFVQSFLLQQKPYKLLLVSTGNIRNSELDSLFEAHLTQIVSLFESFSYVELAKSLLVVHQ
ncbi:MAG: DUF5615 family PIN-like protein [Phormidesmis sp.]